MLWYVLWSSLSHSKKTKDPLMCANSVWLAQREFLQHFVPTKYCPWCIQSNAVQHVIGRKLQQKLIRFARHFLRIFIIAGTSYGNKITIFPDIPPTSCPLSVNNTWFRRYNMPLHHAHAICPCGCEDLWKRRLYKGIFGNLYLDHSLWLNFQYYKMLFLKT